MKLRSLVFKQVKAIAEKQGVFMSREPAATLEHHLKEFFDWAKVNCVLDVGAFVGNYALELRKLGYKGRIISFEPLSDSFAKLSMNLKDDSSWSGQPYGLSDTSRDAILTTHTRGNFNSLLTMTPDAEAAYKIDHDNSGKAQVALRRLDEVLPALLSGIDQPRVFLKMDTQGHDLAVMRGAAGVRPWIVGLQSEMPAIRIYNGMPSIAEMLEAYQGLGFVPIGFYPVNTFQDKQITPEFDVLFNSTAESLE
jgi:FkbM family methyltransferase